MEIVSQANYFMGTVVAVSGEDSDELKNQEAHEIICDVPGVIQGVHCFPFRGELDEPKIGDQVLVLDLDPLYHSYMLYRKIKENDFIGFRSSGKMVSLKPDYLRLGTFDKDLEYKDDEEPGLLDNHIDLLDGGEIDIKSEQKDIKIDAGGTVIINGGYNGGAVNIGLLKQMIMAINNDLMIAGSGANLSALMSQIAQLEDTTFKH